MPKPITAHRVFISYSSKDIELARDIARRLRNAGFEPDTLSGDMATGVQWKNVIRQAIRDAEVVLFLLTPESLASDWTMTELGLAEGFDRRVLPVTVGVTNRDLPAPLKSYKLVPFDRLDKAIDQLSASLSLETDVT